MLPDVRDAAWPWRRAAVNLKVYAGKMMIGVVIQLALEFRIRLNRDNRTIRIGIGFISGQAIDLREFRH